MLGILANDINSAKTPDNFALLAHRFYGSSYFHISGVLKYTNFDKFANLQLKLLIHLC